jgi:adenylate cyclase
MNLDRTNRKLAAIFSTDVVGYSRMMEADEAWTIQNLEENKKLMSSLIEEYKGRVVDSPGDNLLAEFSSVINAVECAVKIQKQLNKKNSKLMEDHRMLFRIGVNLGDVVEEGGKIYGNGVNIAARIEGLAEPGGICISGTAYDHIKGKVEVDYDYLGEYEVKNINEPVRVYRILMGGEGTERYVPHGVSKKLINPISISIAILSLFVLIFGTTTIILYKKPSETRKVLKYTHELPDDQQFSEPVTPRLAVSPDGSQFIYASDKGIYLRSIGELDARLIAGTENEQIGSPVFSPDGKWIAYYSRADNQLKKIPVIGGSPIPLCDMNNVLGETYWIGDKIFFSIGNVGNVARIMQISDNGGTAKLVIEEEDVILLLFPQILPDGKSLLFTKIKNFQSVSIMVKSLETGEIKEITPGVKARYLPTGHLLYLNPDQIGDTNGNLFAIPFDVDKLETTGEPFLIIENIAGLAGVSYAISDSGTLVYVPGIESTNIIMGRSLVWVDREGKEDEIKAPRRFYTAFKISPDGKKIACVATDPQNMNEEIFIWDDISGRLNPRTFDKRDKRLVIWTPDGERIVYYSDHEETSRGIYWKPANGTGKAEKLVSDPDRYLLPYSFTKDGKYLLMMEGAQQSDVDISMLSMVEDYKRIRLIHSEKNIERYPVISPDGQYIAYTSNETGQEEIYVSLFPDVNNGKWQVSEGGGTIALWSPDGRELFYLSSDNSVMVVDVETKPTFIPGTPRTLIQNRFTGFESNTFLWDIHPDGKRFLMVKNPVMTTETNTNRSLKKINVVLNWFEELKEKVPVD